MSENTTNDADRTGIKKRLRQKYGKTNIPQLCNRAIRTELPGGNILLDMMDTLHQMTGRDLSNECRNFVGRCAGELSSVKSDMTDEIKRRYTTVAGRDKIMTMIAWIDEYVQDEHRLKDTFDILNFVRNRLYNILAEMDGESESQK